MLALSSGGEIATSLENEFPRRPLSALLSAVIHVCRHCRIFSILYSLNANYAYLTNALINVDPVHHGIIPSTRITTLDISMPLRWGTSTLTYLVPLVQFKKSCTTVLKQIVWLRCVPCHIYPSILSLSGVLAWKLWIRTWHVALLGRWAPSSKNQYTLSSSTLFIISQNMYSTWSRTVVAGL